MLYYYNEISAEYGKEFAMHADSFAVDMADYTENLSYRYLYGRTPEEFIRAFSRYGSYVYSREEYLWKLSYLLSVKYYFKEGGKYDPETQTYVDVWKVTSTVDEDVYISNYLRLKNMHDGESINRFFEVNEELVAVSIQITANKSLKHLSTEELYSVAEDLFLLYVAEEEINPTHIGWEDFVTRLKFSHQKENFNLTSMLGAFALCTEYGWHEIYWNSWDKENVLAIYRRLKSKSKRDRRLTNLFLVHYGHMDDTPYTVVWKCAR